MNPRKASKPSADADVLTSIRLAAAVISRADALVPVLNLDPVLSAIAPLSRASVLRLAIVEGLAVLESKFTKESPR